jgi:hypothetical protein
MMRLRTRPLRVRRTASVAADTVGGRRRKEAFGMTDDIDELTGPDLVLLLLRAPGTDASAQRDRIHGITRMEKLLFLADQESPLPGKVHDALVFRPYNYGPYSKQVYEAVDVLEDADLVGEEKALNGRPLDAMEEASIAPDSTAGLERRFYLTEDGREVADYLAKQHPDYFQLLDEVKGKYGNLPLRKLIQYVYRRYPKYAEESLIRDQVL